ncbi:hypothetical protein F2Q70_00017758 [Brassica cretica]|uniref:Uncharacterized protein n=1 Tax=Brassica cretica TaxID=69181 RepID=A0A8S9HY98_BRACR|nr:hypothetical protein F2Q70_00017758 [Brassica cretica]
MRFVKKESKIGMKTRSIRPRDLRNCSAISGTASRSPRPRLLRFRARLLAMGFTILAAARAYTRSSLSFLKTTIEPLRWLYILKRNQQNPGTFLVSPRPGRHVIEDNPYRDEKWREQFFVFKMDRASMGEFDFSRLPRSWAENIVDLVIFVTAPRSLGLLHDLRDLDSFAFELDCLLWASLVLVKRNQQNPGTFLVSPRPGRHVIEDNPYRDEKWREQFFVFKMDRASMGEFDFSRLPQSWAENIG